MTTREFTTPADLLATIARHITPAPPADEQLREAVNKCNTTVVNLRSLAALNNDDPHAKDIAAAISTVLRALVATEARRDFLSDLLCQHTCHARDMTVGACVEQNLCRCSCGLVVADAATPRQAQEAEKGTAGE